MQSFQAIFVKHCRIIDYCSGNNPINFGVNPTQNGRWTTSLDFCCHVLPIINKNMQYEQHMRAPPGECLQILGACWPWCGMHSTEDVVVLFIWCFGAIVWASGRASSSRGSTGIGTC